MKKNELLAKGLSEEHAQIVMDAWNEAMKGFIPKARFDEVNEENKTLKQSVSDRDKQLEDVKKSAGDNEALQKQIRDLQDANKSETKKHAAELKELRLTNAIKLAVAGKVHDEDMAAALFDRTKLVLSEDGKVAGLDEQLKAIRESKGFLFKQEKQNPPYDPAGGSGRGTANPFAKDTFNLTEQGKMLRDNPAQAKEMAAAAGIMI